MNDYRISDKHNVTYDGKRTSFKIHVKQGNCFVFAGNFFAKCWNASDDKCIDHYLLSVEGEEYSDVEYD